MIAERWAAFVRSRHAMRWLTLALMAAVLLIILQLSRFQQFEVRVAAQVLAFVMFPDAHVPNDMGIVVFSLTDGQTMGVGISAQNTAALMVLPLLLATVVTVWVRPDQGMPALLALVAASGMVVAENQLRMLAIAVIADTAPPKFRHSIGAMVFSSMFTVICMALAILLFILVFIKAYRRDAKPIADMGEAK